MPETGSVIDLPVGVKRESSRASVYVQRGRFLTPTNAFRDKLPAVPAVTFTAERDRAFAQDTPSGAIAT